MSPESKFKAPFSNLDFLNFDAKPHRIRMDCPISETNSLDKEFNGLPGFPE